MGCYICSECGDLKDDDYNVCIEDPRPTVENGLLCEDCACELEIDEDTADKFRAFVDAHVSVQHIGDEEEDPTPYCHVCGVMEAKYCTCLPYAKNH